jgi:hypothetical protein
LLVRLAFPRLVFSPCCGVSDDERFSFLSQP